MLPVFRFPTAASWREIPRRKVADERRGLPTPGLLRILAPALLARADATYTGDRRHVLLLQRRPQLRQSCRLGAVVASPLLLLVLLLFVYRAIGRAAGRLVVGRQVQWQAQADRVKVRCFDSVELTRRQAEL